MTRTRFAPSPTGYMHIGNLRTALYEYLIAKNEGGKFILRIEDTDRERLQEDSVDVIFNTLKVANLKYDEGPIVGGDYGPYVQSERMDLYLPYAEELVEKGAAYYCFCTKERLDDLSKEQEKEGVFPRYDRACTKLSKEEIEEKLRSGVPYVIRQFVEQSGSTKFNDEVYGEIEVNNSEIEDQILIKSDGYPTYNFANVIDDHLMEITHVVRGSEYLSSTPKYNLLYNAFGFKIPKYVHLPLIQNENGQKLSKRLGDASFEDLLDEGFLPEVIINFIALLGWSPGGENEIFTLDELEKSFSIKGISKSPSVFDKKKLLWMNSTYIKNMDNQKYSQLVLPILKEELGDNKDLNYELIGSILKNRIDTFKDIPALLTFIKVYEDFDSQLFFHKKMKTDLEVSLKSLSAAMEVLQSLPQDKFVESVFKEPLLNLSLEMEIKNGQLLWPLRVALTGLPSSPGGAMEALEILGYDESMRRITFAINKLKGEI